MSPQAGDLLVQEIAPRIHSLARSRSPVGCEDHQELASDATAIAATVLVSIEARGKKVSAGNIAYYAIGLVRQGRRSTGQRKTDPMHPAAQISGRSAMISLDGPLSSASETESEACWCLHEVLADRNEDPSMAAARRLDWQRLMSLLDVRTLQVLNCLLEGHDLTALVPKSKRSRSTLQTDKQRLASLVHEHLGSDILSRVAEQPRWRGQIEAGKQKAACRFERRSK